MSNSSMINDHEKVYHHVDCIKCYMDCVMKLFERASGRELALLREAIISQAQDIIRIMEE